MKTILIAIMGLFLIKGEKTLFDFGTPENSGDWKIVNDGVMGGLSKSDWVLNPDGTATFKGIVSLENNGGFASVRTFVAPLDRDHFKGVKVRVKGDGNWYNIRFRTDRNFDGYAYQAKIKTDKGNWKEHAIPFEDFKPTFRGNTLKNKPALESKNISQIGILISDKQAGNFKLILDWIKYYK
ncbi:CIA30 family protein [Saccharicrinis sp. 156]|uniref:CIA30 family protein n=1 Tax=Saccharicrinis sp. 156 TaxID=3417574 RepID=UPI003D327B77